MNTEKQHINLKQTNSNFNAYPLKFHPILKDRIWGGTKLESLNKNLPSNEIGESWEISMVDQDINVIANGIYENKSFKDLVDQFPMEILGDKVYAKFGNQFPLLFKFLDAKTDLSIQLHPNDEIAKERHDSFGKTEMWYVMQADENARVILGFKKDSSAEEYLQHLENKTLPTVLQEYYVKPGDVFFIETGTIHAIGGGILLAEIQQNSDITYRVYDWDRVDANGNERELHVDLALDAISYKTKKAKIDYTEKTNENVTLVDCPFFTTNIVALEEQYNKTKNTDCFLVYICTEGNANLKVGETIISVVKGETLLVPACITSFSIEGNAKLLEVYINL